MINALSADAPLSQVLRAFNALLGVQQSKWTPLVYSNTWTDYGSGFVTGAWFKDAAGIVHLRGLIKRPTAHVSGETIATLPVGARPTGTEIFNARCASGTFRIDVQAAGTIVIIDDPAASGTPDAYLSLAGTTFRTT